MDNHERERVLKNTSITIDRTSGVDAAELDDRWFIPIAEIRTKGEKYCRTKGSAHYKADGDLEPLDLMRSKGILEHFCIGNIIKYATRFVVTRNLDDLKKVADYAHLACGNELVKQEGVVE